MAHDRGVTAEERRGGLGAGCMYVYTHVYVCLYIRRDEGGSGRVVCMHTHICMYCLCVYDYVCMHICMCVCVHAYGHKYGNHRRGGFGGV